MHLAKASEHECFCASGSSPVVGSVLTVEQQRPTRQRVHPPNADVKPKDANIEPSRLAPPSILSPVGRCPVMSANGKRGENDMDLEED